MNYLSCLAISAFVPITTPHPPTPVFPAFFQECRELNTQLYTALYSWATFQLFFLSAFSLFLWGENYKITWSNTSSLDYREWMSCLTQKRHRGETVSMVMFSSIPSPLPSPPLYRVRTDFFKSGRGSRKIPLVTFSSLFLAVCVHMATHSIYWFIFTQLQLVCTFLNFFF